MNELLFFSFDSSFVTYYIISLYRIWVRIESRERFNSETFSPSSSSPSSEWMSWWRNESYWSLVLVLDDESSSTSSMFISSSSSSMEAVEWLYNPCAMRWRARMFLVPAVFLILALLFWNQILIWDSFSFKSRAKSCLLFSVKYLRNETYCLVFKFVRREREREKSGWWVSQVSEWMKEREREWMKERSRKGTHLFSWNSCLSRANCSAVNAVRGLFSSAAFFSTFAFLLLLDLGPMYQKENRERKKEESGKFVFLVLKILLCDVYFDKKEND